jgi:hypothetical protein
MNLNITALAVAAGLAGAAIAATPAQAPDAKAQIAQLQQQLASAQALNAKLVKGFRACQAQRNAALDGALDDAMNAQ